MDGHGQPALLYIVPFTLGKLNMLDLWQVCLTFAPMELLLKGLSFLFLFFCDDGK